MLQTETILRDNKKAKKEEKGLNDLQNSMQYTDVMKGTRNNRKGSLRKEWEGRVEEGRDGGGDDSY